MAGRVCGGNWLASHRKASLIVGTGPCTFTTSKCRSWRTIRGQWATKEDTRHSPTATRRIWAQESTATRCSRAISPVAILSMQVAIPETMGGASEVTIRMSSGRGLA